MGHFALHCECPGSTSLCTELHAIVHSHTISGLFSQGSSPVWATVGHARRSTEIVSILSFIMLGQTRGRSSSSVVSGWRTSGVYSLQSSTECEGAERPRGDGRSGAAACGVARQPATSTSRSFVALQPADLVATLVGRYGKGGVKHSMGTAPPGSAIGR